MEASDFKPIQLTLNPLCIYLAMVFVSGWTKVSARGLAITHFIKHMYLAKHSQDLAS